MKRQGSSRRQSFGLEGLESRRLLSVGHPLYGGHHHPQARHGHHHQLAVGKRPAPAPSPSPSPSPTPTPTPTPSPTPVFPVTSGQPLSIAQVGSVLQITGNTGSDTIAVSQSGQTYTISNGTWTTEISGDFMGLVVNGNGGNDSIQLDASVTTDATLRGGAGDDTLVGGSGHDAFYAGAGNNQLTGGTADDTFVAIGSSSDTVTGGGGFDNFWLDNSSIEVVTDLSSAESAGGAMHRVSSFLGFNSGGGSVTPISTSLLGQNLPDPIISSGYTYQNFSANPLFGAAGPSEDDVVQGQVGDCWFLSVLSSVAKVDPNRIRESVVDLGDGTYAVQFGSGSTRTFVRVDADLPTFSWGGPAYANFGAGGSLWVAIMEKALTSYRYSTSAAAYANCSSGWMSEAYGDLGAGSGSSISGSSATDWFNQICSALASGQSVTYATKPSALANLVGNHAYTVDQVGYDAYGNAYLVLRNPWGMDGYSSIDGVNDGYVTVSLADAYGSASMVTRASV
jgi:hypothetical protein